MDARFKAYTLILILSAVMFVMCSEKAAELEKQRFFNYANLQYTLNVLCSFIAVAAGGYSLIEMHKLADSKVENARINHEN